MRFGQLMLIIIFIFQFPVVGHLGGPGPLALGPVDMVKDIEVGELSNKLDMVADDAMEVVGQKVHVL